MIESTIRISAGGLLREVIYLLRPFWPLVLFATTFGILSGLATAWLLAAINVGLHSGTDTIWPLLVRFAALCSLSVAGTAIAGIGNSVVGQKIIAALRKDISAKVLRAPIAALEIQHSYRLMSVLTGDIDNVSAFTFNFSAYVIALATIVGSFLYLLTLSPIVFILTIVSLALGWIINMVSQRGWIRDYEGVRLAQDELHKQFRAITDGAKELKMSRPRRSRVHGTLLSGAADRIAALKSRAMRLYWMADAGSSAAFFVVIGVLLAGRAGLGIDPSAISGAVIVLLYVKGPVAQIAGALPLFDQARISLTRIAALSAELDQREPSIPIAATANDTESISGAVKSIELRGVTYAFPSTEGIRPFVLGPIDITIHAGELVFIVGANGSGKTTLIKILLGLYVPTRGTLLLDGESVTPEQRDNYRQLFTTIFSDYYLFDDLASPALPYEAQSHLERLGIAHKVRLEGDRFSTTDLSTGQRKRLALVQAYLEHRPVIVTDEWAADQDPEFRHIFYEQLLPELKAHGKTTIVISHDDRYFHVADRIVRMTDGKIVEDCPLNADTQRDHRKILR
jgi:putative ATP-binding cassette transporter